MCGLDSGASDMDYRTMSNNLEFIVFYIQIMTQLNAQTS